LTLYGVTGTLTGGYTIQLDGEPIQSFNGSRPFEFDNNAGQVIYAVNGLDSNVEHKVLVSKSDGREGRYVGVDYAVLGSMSSSSPSLSEKKWVAGFNVSWNQY
jgi:hypothetical protein